MGSQLTRTPAVTANALRMVNAYENEREKGFVNIKLQIYLK